VVSAVEPSKGSNLFQRQKNAKRFWFDGSWDFGLGQPLLHWFGNWQRFYAKTGKILRKEKRSRPSSGTTPHYKLAKSASTKRLNKITCKKYANNKKQKQRAVQFRLTTCKISSYVYIDIFGCKTSKCQILTVRCFLSTPTMLSQSIFTCMGFVRP